MKQVFWIRRSTEAAQRCISARLFFLLAISVAITPLLIGCMSPSTTAPPLPAATPRLVVTPSSVSFTSAVVGVETSQTLQLANTGGAALTVTGVIASGAGLSVSGFSGSTLLNPGTSHAITIQFTPKTAGAFIGTLSVLTNTAAPTDALPVTGEVAAAKLAISVGPSSLSFGTVSAGKTISQTVTLTNTGNTDVTVSKVTVSGAAFSMTGWSSAVKLASSQSTTVDVQFDPKASGNYTGSLVVASNASDSSVDVALSGAVPAPPAAPNPPSPSAAHYVALAWDASSSVVSGYNVYRAAAVHGPFTRLNGSLLGDLSFTDNNVAAGDTYYYVTTAVDHAGVESGYSNTAQALVP